MKDIEKYWKEESKDCIDEGLLTNDQLEKTKEYVTLDSGKREEFKGGAVRDTEEGKPRFDLIPPLALKRIADLYARGAKKYDEWNWAKTGGEGEGMKFSRIYSSGLRHFMQFGMGLDDEDHLAAVAFSVLSILHFQEMGRNDLDDMPKWCKIRNGEKKL